jgi:hypothetical protein
LRKWNKPFSNRRLAVQQGILGQWWKIGGICGIAFIVIFFVAGFGIQGETPMYDDPIEEIRQYWADDGNMYLAGDYLLGLGTVLFFLPFLLSLRAILARAEGGPAIWSNMGFLGGLLMVVIAATASGSWTALAFASEDLDEGTLRTLMYLDIGAWNAFPYMVGMVLLFSSIVMAMTGAFWKWLGYLGIVLGIIAFITPLGILDEDPEDVFDSIGFIAFIGLAVWVVAASVGMLMKDTDPVGMTTADRAMT